MAKQEITINLTDADAAEGDVQKPGKVTWHNATTDTSITLNPPSCVSPNNQVVIAPGCDSTHNTNNSANGTYAYTFTVGAELGTRNGRIVTTG